MGGPSRPNFVAGIPMQQRQEICWDTAGRCLEITSDVNGLRTRVNMLSGDCYQFYYHVKGAKKAAIEAREYAAKLLKYALIIGGIMLLIILILGVLLYRHM